MLLSSQGVKSTTSTVLKWRNTHTHTDKVIQRNLIKVEDTFIHNTDEKTSFTNMDPYICESFAD